MKRLLQILPLLLIVTLLLTGCAEPQPTTFTEAGVQITLTDAFVSIPTEGFDFTYGSKHLVVMGTKDTKTELLELGFAVEEDSTVQDYLQFVIKQNKMQDTALLTEKEGVPFFTYSAQAEGTTFRYLATAYRQGDSFWLVQFSCQEKKYADNEATFLSWAKTVAFV